MIIKRVLLAYLLVCHSTGASTGDRGDATSRGSGTVGWTPYVLPSPETDPDTCRSSSLRICNPDSILSEQSVSDLNEAILSFEQSQSISCESSATDKQESDEEFQCPVQLAVTVVGKMEMPEMFSYGDEKRRKAAEQFATLLHNKWGVGEVTPCGGSGILIFLSAYDRVMHISTGEALENVLSNHRLDRVIDNMKDLLRKQRVGDALIQAVAEIADLVNSGEPAFKERCLNILVDSIPMVAFFFFVVVIMFKSRLDRQRQREYVQVQSQLTQLDRDRAEALQGRYRCVSCPICLGDFPTTTSPTQETAGTNNETSDEATDGSQRTSNTAPRLGNDGLPLKLLRCGHVFDETCWSEWVSSGTGDVGRCPICQQDVTESQPPNGDLALRQRNPRQGERNNDRLIQLVNRERNFRLMRLAYRFPRYVNQRQVRVWTQPGYEGSLVRDPGFVRNNPVRNDPVRSRVSGSHSSFGGGMGTRGRGGTW